MSSTTYIVESSKTVKSKSKTMKFEQPEQNNSLTVGILNVLAVSACGAAWPRWQIQYPSLS